MTTAELTDTEYDIADAVELWLEQHPGFHSASKIGRGVKADTSTARRILDWMVASVFVVSTGNGAWTNYSAR